MGFLVSLCVGCSVVSHFRSFHSFFCYFRSRFSVENQIVVRAVDCLDGGWIDPSRRRCKTNRKWKIVCGWWEFGEGQARRSRSFRRWPSGACASSKSNCRTPWIGGTYSTRANRSLGILRPSHAIRSFGPDYPSCASLPCTDSTFGTNHTFGTRFTFGPARASCPLTRASLSKTLNIRPFRLI